MQGLLQELKLSEKTTLSYICPRVNYAVILVYFPPEKVLSDEISFSFTSSRQPPGYNTRQSSFLTPFTPTSPYSLW